MKHFFTGQGHSIRQLKLIKWASFCRFRNLQGDTTVNLDRGTSYRSSSVPLAEEAFFPIQFTATCRTTIPVYSQGGGGPKKYQSIRRNLSLTDSNGIDWKILLFTSFSTRTVNCHQRGPGSQLSFECKTRLLTWALGSFSGIVWCMARWRGGEPGERGTSTRSETWPLSSWGQSWLGTRSTPRTPGSSSWFCKSRWRAR